MLIEDNLIGRVLKKKHVLWIDDVRAGGRWAAEKVNLRLKFWLNHYIFFLLHWILFIFGTHMYLTEAHILSADVSGVNVIL